eukprot:TRINITY_DN3127_c0_g1_i1.p1 TRINITY_DN3127_c0_g1~~TRINITY_DN3127_c0_g1_i1.p1  ORF type:complete len:431 (+),score=87.93 TRINITY_DN3127_c0_g1_i1:219-1511(+)
MESIILLQSGNILDDIMFLQLEREDYDQVEGIEIIDTSNTIRLYEPGYKDRYYTTLFKDHSIQGVCGSYLRGIVWNLSYYFRGNCSWEWFYEYHYAPIPSDIGSTQILEETNIFKFELGHPLFPFQQLLSVLPPSSSVFLPEAFRDLMVSNTSPISYLYQDTFVLDLNGRRRLWQAHALLDFFNIDDLTEAYESVNLDLLTFEELQNNSFGMDIIFTNHTSIMGSTIVQYVDVDLPKERKSYETSIISGYILEYTEDYVISQFKFLGRQLSELYPNILEGAHFEDHNIANEITWDEYRKSQFIPKRNQRNNRYRKGWIPGEGQSLLQTEITEPTSLTGGNIYTESPIVLEVGDPITTILVKYNNGTQETLEVNQTTTIGIIKQHVMWKLDLIPGQEFELMTTFPRQILNDEQKSIGDLGIEKSVVIMKCL